MTSSATRDTIGFIGLGVMGRGMAASLLRAGHDVVVHNRSRAAETPLAEAGARRAATPAELGGMARVVMLCLSDTAAVESVLFGPQGLAASLPAGAFVIDTSTISASATREHARRLAERQVALLDAPVSGGQQAAEQGTLSCMVGASEAAFAACLPYLQVIASRVLRVGDNGAGQVAKACNQVAVSAVMLGVAEAFALAHSSGVDPAVVREALLGGAARSAVLEKNAVRILQRDFKPGFRAGLMRKDLRLALDAARDAGACLPVASTTLQWLEALCNTGHAEDDWSAVGQLIAEMAAPPR
ncbi:NAD(P)-dependent oxidoreductase [Bordetella petrii]|uniref:NAD(P)-dependent oxidoreductase n=1 Tax=Bordetella petrii TaxID=94624 RepID=UPI00372F495F